MRFIKPVKAGGVELPALTSPGVAGDLAQGKELIDGAGNKITGTVQTFESGTGVPASAELVVSDGVAQMEYEITDSDGSVMFRPGSTFGLHCDASELGDATAADVAEGKTFTSVNGKVITGTAAAPDSTVEAGAVYLKSINKTTETGTVIQHSHTLSEDVLLKSGSIVRIGMTNASYGNATAADVASGKTFTGADGFKKVGTLEKYMGFKVLYNGLLNGYSNSNIMTLDTNKVYTAIAVPLYHDYAYYAVTKIYSNKTTSQYFGYIKFTISGDTLILNGNGQDVDVLVVVLNGDLYDY